MIGGIIAGVTVFGVARSIGFMATSSNIGFGVALVLAIVMAFSVASLISEDTLFSMVFGITFTVVFSLVFGLMEITTGLGIG